MDIALAQIGAGAVVGQRGRQRNERFPGVGDQRGGVVQSVVSLGALALAMLGEPVWLVANAILAGLVAGEIVKAVSKLIDYRRGV